MRNPQQVTNFIVLTGVLALAGCASARLEYASSHGYHPFGINYPEERWRGAVYYCRPQPAISGNNAVAAMNCLTASEFENVRTGRQGDSQFRHPPNAPETAFVLAGEVRPVSVLIDGQEWFCEQPPFAAPPGSRLRSPLERSQMFCFSSPAVAKTAVEASLRARDEGTWRYGDR